VILSKPLSSSCLSQNHLQTPSTFSLSERISPIMMPTLPSSTFLHHPLPALMLLLRAKNKSKGKDKKKDSSHNQLGKNEYSFCKKWNHLVIGYIYKNCKVLKDLKAGNTPVPSAPLSGIANIANDSSSAPSSCDHYSGVVLPAISTASDGTALYSNIESQKV
jgi:hypothetical protein